MLDKWIRDRARETDAVGRDYLLRGGDRSDDLDIGTVFETLADRRRRIALYYLSGSDEEWVPVEELVDQIAAWEQELQESPDRDSIERSLYHSHLPGLEADGIVTYDEDEQEVNYHYSERLELFLDVAAAESLPL